MNNLPNSWGTAPLEYIARVEMGQSPESRFYNDRGEGLPFFQGKTEFGPLYPTVRKWCTDPKKIADKGDILLSVRAPVGPTNVATEQCCIGRGLAAIRAHDPVSQTYLLHLFRNMEPWLSDQGTGTTFAAVSGQFLRSIDVALAPLNEQKRIADKLDAVLARVDACRDRLDRIPAILKRFRQSVLAAATSGKLTEDWRADQVARMEPQAESGNIARDSAQSHYVVTAAPDSATLHPGYEANTVDWQQTDVQSVAHVGTGSTPLRSNSTFFAPTGTPWITSAATSQTLVTDANEFVTQAAITAHRLKMYPIGTLLVAMYGEGKTRGQVTELGIPATINQACAAIVVNEEKALKSYVKLALQANYFEMRELAEGGNQPNLNLSKIKEFPLSLPGITEQAEIVRRVESLFAYADRLEARYAAARTQVEKLTPATLAKAFRGELVPQDPNDEPASVLLERIKARRSNQAAINPKRSRKAMA